MIRTLALSLVALLAVSPALASAFIGSGKNLLINGGFETPVVSSDQEFSAPSLAISGWRVSGGSIDLVTSGTILGTAHSGSQMIDINGSRAGTIEQTFATIPGNRYRLEAFYSNNPNPASAEPNYSATVKLVGTVQLLNALVQHSGATELEMNWLRFAHAFVADSTTTRLILSSAQGATTESILILCRWFQNLHMRQCSRQPAAFSRFCTPAAFAARRDERGLDARIANEKDRLLNLFADNFGGII